MSHMGTNAREIGDFSVAVSAELRAAIARANYSVRAFSRASHFPLTTLHKTLRAERVVDVEDIAQICDFLDIEPSDLLGAAEQSLRKAGKWKAGERVVPDSRYNNRGEDDDDGSSNVTPLHPRTPGPDGIMPAAKDEPWAASHDETQRDIDPETL